MRGDQRGRQPERNTSSTQNVTNAQHEQDAQSTTTGQGATGTDRERELRTEREVRGPGTSRGLPRHSGSSRLERFGSPYALMRRMADDLDRLFAQLGVGGSSGGESATWSPQVEVFRRGTDLVVRADLPGVKKEDLHVDIDDDALILSGERRDEREERGEGFYRSERSYGHFRREIPLPDGVDPLSIDARYVDGVLEVKIPAPKQESREPRRIQVR